MAYPQLSVQAWLRTMALLLIIFVFPQGVAASVPVLVERLDAPVASIGELLAGDHDHAFVEQVWAAITPSRQHAVWYRIRPARAWNEQRPPVLSVFDPEGLRIRAYLPPDYVELASSVDDRHRDTGFTHHAMTFLLPPDLAADTPIYLQVDPERAVPRRVDITGMMDAHRSDVIHAQLQVLFPAIQLATVLVMLSFFFVLRERTYGYFVAHVLFLVLYEIYEYGLGYSMPPFNLLSGLQLRPVWLFALLAALFLGEFSRVFLDLKRVSPRADRTLVLARWPLLGLALCAAIPGSSTEWWIEDILATSMLLFMALLVLCGFLAWRRNSRRGAFYLAAWIPALSLAAWRVLLLVLHKAAPEWIEVALPASFAFACMVLALGLADKTLSIRNERDVANHLAQRDALTGALNRRAIFARLRAAFQLACDKAEPLSLLFIDLDHFKQINDRYGHGAGDECLRAVVGPITGELRHADALGRYGGEEFLVVLPRANAHNAQAAAERIRKRIEDMPLTVSGVRVDLTLSVGVAELEPGVTSPEELIQRADAALYRAKQGRNRVCVHGREPQAPLLRLA